MLNLLKQTYLAKKNDKLNREQLLNLQQYKFQKLVEYAYNHSPYYRNIINKNNISLSNPKLQDFPILTREQVVNHFDDLVTDRNVHFNKIIEFTNTSSNDSRLFLNKYYVAKTSGSSGNPLHMIYKPNEMYLGVSPGYRGRKLTLNKRKIAFIGSGVPFTTSKITMGFFNGSFLSKMFVDYKFIPVDVSSKTLLDELNTFKPNIICSFGKILLYLADLKEKQHFNFNIDELGTGGELLFTFEKKYLEASFKAQLFSQYASTENIIMGTHCPHQKGFMLAEDQIIFEINTDNTLTTNLYNYSLPLIRYQTDDVLKPLSETTDHFPYQTVAEQVGRATKNNSENLFKDVHPYFYNLFFSQVNKLVELKTAQFEFQSNKKVILLIQPKKQATVSDVQLDQIRSKFIESFSFSNIDFSNFKVEVKETRKMDQNSKKTSLFIENY